MLGDARPRLVEGFLHAVTRGTHHLRVDAQFLAVVDAEVVGGGIGVEDGGDVVFGVTRCKQHARYGKHAGNALCLQAVEARPDDGGGELEIAVFNRVLRQVLLEMFGQHCEFPHRILVAAAVSAQHHTQFFRHRSCLPDLARPRARPGPEDSPGLGPAFGSAAPEFAFSPVSGDAVKRSSRPPNALSQARLRRPRTRSRPVPSRRTGTGVLPAPFRSPGRRSRSVRPWHCGR